MRRSTWCVLATAVLISGGCAGSAAAASGQSPPPAETAAVQVYIEQFPTGAGPVTADRVVGAGTGSLPLAAPRSSSDGARVLVLAAVLAASTAALWYARPKPSAGGDRETARRVT